MSRAELFEAARRDPLVAWDSSGRDPRALAAVLAGAAARAAALLDGDAHDPDYQRRFGAVASHASVAEILALCQGDGLALEALARESSRYAWSAIELALRTTRSAELDELGRTALELLAARPADEPLDRALARERLGLDAAD